MAWGKKEFEGWEKEKVIAQVGKNDKGDFIKVSLVQMKGKDYVDVRNFWHNKEGECLPGKGIVIPADIADEIADKIMQATQEDFNTASKKKGKKGA